MVMVVLVTSWSPAITSTGQTSSELTSREPTSMHGQKAAKKKRRRAHRSSPRRCRELLGDDAVGALALLLLPFLPITLQRKVFNDIAFDFPVVPQVQAKSGILLLTY
jgi:hypothetical protein